MIPSTPATHSQLDELLTGLVDRVADVHYAVVLSEDGLVVSKATAFLRDEAERLAATVSGLMSLSRGGSADFRVGPVLQALIEMRHGFPLLTSTGPGAYLAVLTTEGADVGVVAYQMNMLIKSADRGDLSGRQKSGEENSGSACNPSPPSRVVLGIRASREGSGGMGKA